MAAKKIQMYKRKETVEFTPARKQQFLELMRSHPDMGGRRSLCLEAIGVSGSSMTYHLRMDVEFAEAYKDAQQQWIDENLYTAAVKRSVEGCIKPIMGGRFKDEIVAEVREYSDSLTLALLRAARPDFRDKGPTTEGAADTQGGVMIVPSAPGTMGEWQDLLGASAKGTVPKDGQNA